MKTLRNGLVLTLSAMLIASFTAGATAVAGPGEPPKTGFEESGGAEWTTHEQELEFLDAVDSMSKRVEIDVIGKTKEGRPLHLVQLGDPAPRSVRSATKVPTILYVCSQHGNEPAGRETCLRLLRDLAFTDDPKLVEQLRNMTILFVPTANPDGRAANTRGNSDGTDINRDHLNLVTPEGQAMGEVVRDWKPDLSLDLHEYGPSIPVLYDDELLYLWPRNLNVDQKVHDLAHELANEYIEPAAEEAGYSADEYGQYEVADQDIHQSAGDGDEGIMRNAMGLRHSLGVLVETAVSEDPRNGPQEVIDVAALQNRRVDAHMVVALEALRFFREKGTEVAKETSLAMKRKTLEGKTGSAPVYFGGADNQEPEAEAVVDPPPCGYRLTGEQKGEVATTLKILGIKARGTFVSMAQPAEPVIPLLLDERGTRHSVTAEPLTEC
ncbi:MAG: M14 family metallopeptidase [Actinomycetota bacterium]